MSTILSRAHWTTAENEAVEIKMPQSEIYIHYPGPGSDIGRDSKQGIISRLQGIRYDHLHSDEDWVEIAYNWAVDQVGRIWELRGKRQSGANGTLQSNRRGQSILCIIGQYETPTLELIAAVNDCIAYIRDWQPGAIHIYGHRDSVSTECPGDKLYALLQAGAFGKSGQLPMPDDDQPIPLPDRPDIEIGLEVDGRFGQTTVRTLQRRLGITADGKAGAGTWRALQSFLGTTVDGVVSNQSYTAEELGNGITGGWQYVGRNASGSTMVRELQAYIGVRVDGIWGQGTTAALQRYLNNREDAFEGPTLTPVNPNLTVDGRFGQSTVRELQRRLGITVDGKAGPGTWRALQSYLGTRVDGVVSSQSFTASELGNGITGGWDYVGRNASGSSMVRDLQDYIGERVDGIWGEGTTTALQRHLNRNDSAFK